DHTGPLERASAGSRAQATTWKQHSRAMDERGWSIAVRVTRKLGEQSRVLCAVSSKDEYEQLVSQGYAVERKQVHLREPLKEIGTHEVEVRLHPEVVAKVKVTIAPEA